MHNKLFEPLTLGELKLTNAVVMAPMTRSRADVDDSPTTLMAEYYAQRASAGMIITEGVHPNVDGKAYMRSPGLYNEALRDKWQALVQQVRSAGDATLVMQLMHCGRIGAKENKAVQARLLAPSAVKADASMYTEHGRVEVACPDAMSRQDIDQVIAAYVNAAKLAREANFDGVELHFASGYLPEQFLSSNTNRREDDFGGSLHNRLRFPLALVDAVCAALGSARVGVRLCPGNSFNDIHDEHPLETYRALLEALDTKLLAYIHIIRSPNKQIDAFAALHVLKNSNFIFNDSLSMEEVGQIIDSDRFANASRAFSFARQYIANPDLVARFKQGVALNEVDFSTIYSGGAKGYIDYPFMNEP